MTVQEAPALYEAALLGGPLQRTVFPEPLNTRETFWTLGDWQIAVPAFVPRRVPRLQRTIKEVRDRTGWSARRLAEIVGTSHTMILSAENGRPLISGHSGELRRRLVEVHDLVERVHVLVGGDQERTFAALESRPPGRSSAVEELKATGDSGRAYLAVLDALRPRPVGILTSSRPRPDGPTTALHE